MKSVLFLVGSNRDGSFNQRLADQVAELLPEGASAVRCDQLDQLPVFSQNLETDVPLTVLDLRAAVSSADLLVMITPEHNGGPSALLKNALDWISRPRGSSVLQDKPVLVLGATPSPMGTAQARETLLTNLKFALAAPIEETFGLANAHEHEELPTEMADGIRAALAAALA